jgi:outer membrane protein assembly factor BamD (BamD/ComL family)
VPAELPTAGTAPAVPTPVVSSKSRATPSVPATDAIALEAELVHRAEAAIAKGKLRAADAVLDTYVRRFGAGQMAREVSMLRIVVACGESDTAAVEAAVRRHAAAHPEDPALARLRAQPCARTGSP